MKTLDIKSKRVKLQLWDTAGQERYKDIVSSYFRHAHGFMLVYDITDMESFENLNSWLNKISEKALKMFIKF